MNDRLTPELVLSAYCQGCFPMADPETGEILSLIHISEPTRP